MYVPKPFGVSDQSTMLQFIRENGFGLLISWNDNGPTATHLPFLVESEDDGIVLYGHVAKANPHWKLFSKNESLGIESPESLVVFHGAHAYISPAWYQSPGVPTWNYTAVHAYGVACLIDDKQIRNEIVLNLSDQYERGRADPWIPDYGESMLDAIVGFKISVRKIEGKFKLSQNRSEADRNGAIEGLEQGGSDNERSIAGMMTKL